MRVRLFERRLSVAVLSIIVALTMVRQAALATAEKGELADLGRALFFDVNLSANRNQSCASCHDPARAFSDSRDNGVSGAVSLGSDGFSLGDRNAPSTTYAFLIPNFHKDDENEFVGGYFHDGRAPTMVDQTGQPLVDQIEMALTDDVAVVNRVRENPAYVESLEELFGASIFDQPERAFRAITQSIVAFERTEEFAPFDSRYDRFLRGEYQLSDEEELGRLLFFSSLTNCVTCHTLNRRESSVRETFTDHHYYNIGVPINRRVRQMNNLPEAHRDLGLLENPAVDDPSQAGKFRVPSLRNVAVTGPYMHNGVFQELSTAIFFYGKFMLSNQQSQINPETEKVWGKPEVAETIELEVLNQGQPITSDRAELIATFLKTLTDQRYESLLR
jgi:cytochrome c peroxidase